MGKYYSAKDAKADCIRNYHKRHIETYESLDQVLNVIKDVVHANTFSALTVFEYKFLVNKDKFDGAKNTVTTLNDLGYFASILFYGNDTAKIIVSWEYNTADFINEIKDSDPELANELANCVYNETHIEINL